MKRFEKISISICLLLYLATKVFDYFEVEQSYFVKNYLADLVCMPLVFFVIRAIIKKIKPFKKWNRLPLFSVLFVTVYWSIYFEYFLPSRSTQYIGDSVDVLMYFLGSIIFILIERREIFLSPKRV